VTEHDLSFPAMGSQFRLLIGDPLPGERRSPGEAAAMARDIVEELERRLSRFLPDSELCALNADPRSEVPASQLLRGAVSAGLWAARRTNGLIDPTLLTEIELAGYRGSRVGAAPARLAEALAKAPARHPARAHPDSPWQAVEVDEQRGTIRRPPGVRFDTGGAGKGLTADAIGQVLVGFSRFVVDCGGDLCVGGPDAAANPYGIDVEHPLTRDRAHVIRLGSGGVATSGLNNRVWERGSGYAHHLLDPSTGEPAWTGLVGATAIGASALEADTLAKAALLMGPAGARELLREQGGLIVGDDGEVELLGPLARARTRVTAGELRPMVAA